MPGNYLFQVAVDAAILIAIGVTLWQKIEAAPFHIDEVAWTGYGYYYGLFFEKRDILSPDWHIIDARRDFPVGKYLFGFGLKLLNYPILDLKVHDAFSRLWQDPYKLRDAAPPGLIMAGRKVAWFFSTLAVWLIYILTRRLGGILAGMVAAVLLIINPLSVIFVQALTDTMLLSCLVGGALIVSAWRSGPERLSHRRIWFTAISTGLLTGIAAGIKANGAILGIYLMLAIVWVCVRKKTPPVSRASIIVSLIIAGMAAIAIFVGINPALYDNPCKEVLSYLQFKAGDVAHQQAYIGPAIRGASDKISMVIARTLLWGPYVPFPFVGLFALAGLWRLIGNFVKKPFGGEITLLIWCAVMYGSVTLWIPLDWDRYYLPAVAAVATISAIGIVATLETMILPVRKRFFPNSK